MSKADKMLYNLGYRVVGESGIAIYYEKYWVETDCIEELTFGKDTKDIELQTNKDNVGNGFDVKKHLEIQEKMKELGWLDEN